MAHIEVQTVKTATFAMDYIRFGQGEETLVVLPGLSVQSVMLQADAIARAYKPLTERFTVYVFDRRKKVPAEYSVYDMARDTQDAIQALGLNRIALFGASQGGMMALCIALQQPQLVQKLIVGSSTARITQAHYQRINGWIEQAKQGDTVGLYQGFAKTIFPQKVYELSQALLLEAANSVTAEDLRRFIVLAQGINGFDVLDEVPKIACPVLVIGSADDQIFGAGAAFEIAQVMRDRTDFQLFMYGGYGHAAYDTAPDFKERLLEFLTRA